MPAKEVTGKSGRPPSSPLATRKRAALGAKDLFQAQLYEKAFQLAAQKAWSYLSPEQVTLLKKQSQEVRAKKVY